MSDAASVRVMGSGMLATAVGEAVREPAVAERADLVVSASDCWSEDEESRRWARQRGVPWLPVHVELGVVVIGPLERPSVRGCARCAWGRRHRASSDPDGSLAAFTAHRETLSATPSTLLTALTADTVAALVVAEAASLVGDGSARTVEALLRVDLPTAEVSRHPFLPDPCCPDCAEHVAPVVRLDVAPLEPRPKPDRHTYRLRPELDPDELRAQYVEPEAGLIRELQYGTSAGMALVRAPMRLRGRHRSSLTESGYGRTRDFRTSETVAICEALERYGGLRQGEPPEVVRASHREVADQAIDVAAVGLHSPESYELEGFGCVPFDPDREYGWVRGYSFARRGAVLVPERLAYYGIGDSDEHGEHDRAFVLESSNGGATGSCLEEAILHGVLEVVERDAFLMTWYARLPAPVIDPFSAADRTIPLLVEQIRHEQGYRVSLFDTTLDHGVPSVWAMAVRADDDESRPKVCCSAGAHLLPERAIGGALAELGPILDGLIDAFPRAADRVPALVADSGNVARMVDHGLLYGDSRVFDRLEFLTVPRQPASIAESFGADRPTIAGADLTKDLHTLTDRLLADGLDVVAVEQTTDEHRRAGLSCVKVLVPGMLPMTFGHAYRRLRGLPRLREVPVRLGHAARPLTDAEINPYPHPFP